MLWKWTCSHIRQVCANSNLTALFLVVGQRERFLSFCRISIGENIAAMFGILIGVRIFILVVLKVYAIKNWL